MASARGTIAAILFGGCLLYPSTAFAPNGIQSPPTLTTTSTAIRRSPLFRVRRRPPSLMRDGSSPSALAAGLAPGIELAGLLYDSTSTAFDAWGWTANLGAPAALVAGAVLVTLSETRESMAPRKSDKNWVRHAKQAMRFLLLSSFALEVISILVGTITGTVLISHGSQQVAKKMVGYTSPLGLLHHHHEMEFLTIQIGFLQGLFNWLAAVALEVIIPKENENKSAKRMNQALASWLLMLTLWILAFWNHHLTFYSDYASMLKVYGGLFVKRYIFCSPIRPMAFLYGPAAVVSSWLTLRAFKSPPEEDDD